MCINLYVILLLQFVYIIRLVFFMIVYLSVLGSLRYRSSDFKMALDFSS